MDADFSLFNNFLNTQTNKDVFARFFDKYVKTGKTQENGLPEFVKRTYVEIRVKDSYDVTERPAEMEDFRRFPNEYNFYKVKEEKTKQGTPLNQFAFLTPAQIEGCNIRGVFTVEDLAQLTPEQAQSLSLVDEVSLAKNFLEASKNNAVIDEYKKREKELKSRIEQLENELEALKNEQHS